MSRRCTDRDQDLLLLVHGQVSLLQGLRLRLHLLFCRECRKRSRAFTSVSTAFRAELGQARIQRRRVRPSIALAAAMACILVTLSLAFWAHTTLSWYSFEPSPAATITPAQLEEIKKNRGEDKSGPRSHAQKPSRASVD